MAIFITSTFIYTTTVHPPQDLSTLSSTHALSELSLAPYSDLAHNRILHLSLTSQIGNSIVKQGQSLLKWDFFQVQDDYLDCFGDPSVTGKVGTDIAEGKCTWLSVVALQRATPAQRALMEQHYGNPEEESVNKVRALYKAHVRQPGLRQRQHAAPPGHMRATQDMPRPHGMRHIQALPGNHRRANRQCDPEGNAAT
ncbi:farnesyl diphosphate synthase [Penaeus vannamei]|uniref:Farnesyl diphosphate synthase n=1 Tax=Penaeus vannamei TaxID=6689 RepID=A0A3R7LZE8_PENVA|nr:farnesyl diphosphate synthase [Penaeus vannamei]